MVATDSASTSPIPRCNPSPTRDSCPSAMWASSWASVFTRAASGMSVRTDTVRVVKSVTPFAPPNDCAFRASVRSKPYWRICTARPSHPSGWRLPVQQNRVGRFGDRVAVGLGHVPHVAGFDTDQLHPHLLTGPGPFSAAEAPPRARIQWVHGGEPSGDRGSDHVPGLSLQHVPAELLPLPEPGHIGGLRGPDASQLVRLGVLQPEQQGVGE
jgi:hypothetical protein